MTDERPWLAQYRPDVPAEITVPDGSIVDLLDAAVEASGSTIATDFYGGTLTYAQLGDQVARAASALAGLGVNAGDRVGIVLPNCIQHVVAFHAILRLGAVVVEHNPLYTHDELATQFADHRAGVIVCWDAIADTAVAAAAPGTTVVAVDITRDLPLGKRVALRLPLAKARAMRSAMTKPAPGLPQWSALVAAARPIDPSAPRPASTDVALLQYTGGTTGVPKGAMLTHRNLIANATQARAWAPMLHDGVEVIYAVLPLFHVYGLQLCLVTATHLRSTVVLFPRFDADQVLDAMARRACTFLPGVPPLYPKLLERAATRQVPLTSIKLALAGAMSLPPATVDAWESVAGGWLIEGYGMTETSPITIGNPIAANRRPGSIGVPWPSTDIRIVDRANPAIDLPPGEPGELLIRGPQVFAGYWDRPEATEATLLPGGWVRTGDVVIQDDDGFVRIVDRIKELVLVGGFNVYPSEVEAVLLAMPGVADAAVVSLPSDDGERVVAAVVPDEGAHLDPEAMRVECRQHLAGYKVPREIVLIDDLPRSTIGKVLRGQVRARLLDR